MSAMTTRTGGTTPKHLRIGRWRFSTRELLVALVLLFGMSPFVETLRHGEVLESSLMTLMLVSAVLAVGERRRTLFVTILLATPAILAKWLHRLWPEHFPVTFVHVASLVFLGFAIVKLLQFVVNAPRVNSDVLCACISALLLLGLLWAIAYELEYTVNPDAFSFSVHHTQMDSFNAFYFSFVTLSTVGYGDIVPVSRVARMLAVTEAMTGLLYVAVLIARLVALYTVPLHSIPTRKKTKKPTPENEQHI